MTKKIILLLILLIIPNFINAKEIDIHLFYSETCPHCKDEIAFLEDLKKQGKELNIILYEVSDFANSSLTNKVKKAFAVESPGVPFTTIGTRSFLGFSEDTGYQIEEAIKYYEKNELRDIAKEVKAGEFDPVNNPIEKEEENRETFKLPILGEINAKSISLPLLAIVLGAVDGFNPCAMWVLLFLIGMTMSMKDKKKLWLVGGTFLVTSAIVYMIIMFSLLQVVVQLSTINIIRTFIGLFAISAGIFSLNKFRKSLKEDKGCTVVDQSKRKKLIEKTKKILSQEKGILIVIGVITLAITVNVVELACSAGLPFIFTQILALNDITGIKSFAYIFIYILFFLIDDLIIFAIAVKSFEKIKTHTKYANIVSLIGGLLMLLIGISMIFFPELLIF